jgi:1-acyl-sn-glycerol-3-phosphate acyltransferase
MIGKLVRASGRLIRCAAVIATAGADYFVFIRLRGKSGRLAVRAEWLRRHSGRMLAALHVSVEQRGVPPAGGMLAANHLGYVDILVLGAGKPMVFLSKSEVRRWPVIGVLTACAGTLFIRRDRKSDVARFDESFARVVNAGLLLGLFPEGTSSNGHQVLPFHSSLFASAVAAQWPVTPVWLGYAATGGSVENDVCYWGDMTFFSHFLRLLTVEHIRATVVYGTALPAGLDRKAMARQLHQEVGALAEQHGPGRA